MFYEYEIIPYTQDCCLNQECPITHNLFRENQDHIVCLPCQHGFEPDSIHRWLFLYYKRECPVCRCPILMFDEPETSFQDNTNQDQQRRQYDLSSSAFVLSQWFVDTFYRDGVFTFNEPQTIDEKMYASYMQSMCSYPTNSTNSTNSSPIFQYFPFHII
jgi:hypothetical protein